MEVDPAPVDGAVSSLDLQHPEPSSGRVVPVGPAQVVLLDPVSRRTGHSSVITVEEVKYH